MARTTSFVLGPHFESFLSAEVASGRYASGSEVIREGLRLLEVRKQKLDGLRAALIDGESSGPSRVLTPKVSRQIKARARKRAGIEE